MFDEDENSKHMHIIIDIAFLYLSELYIEANMG